MENGEARSSLWRNRNFVRLWSAATVSAFGTLVTAVAIPFTAVLTLHAGPFQVALLGAAGMAPGALIGLFAGAWIDRLPRRPVLIVSDLGRAVLLVSVPAAWFAGVLRVELLYAVAFSTGILTTLFDVAHHAYLPFLVRRGQLVDGNAKLSASSSAAEVGAFGAGGWLVQLLTGPVAVLVDAVSFLVSAAFIARIRAPEPPRPPREETASVRREIVEGLRFVMKSPVLRPLWATAVAHEFFMRAYGSIYVLFVARELRFAPGILGLTFAIGGVSSLGGAVLARRTTQRLGAGPSMIAGIVVTGVLMLALPFARGATGLALALICLQQSGDGAWLTYEIADRSVRQAVTPAHMLGRADASVRFASFAARIAGIFVGGVVAEVAGLRLTMAAAAVGTILASVWLFSPEVRRLREVVPDEKP